MAESLADEWRSQGYVVVRRVLDGSRAARLRAVCDRVLEQWRRRDPQTGAPGDCDATVMRHLNHPAYFLGGTPGLEEIFSVCADPAILALARELLGEEPMFRCTSYFMNPLENGHDGDWHRDSQYETASEVEERELVAKGGDSGAGLQLQIALVPSDDVEIVPGSHLRYDTSDEYAVRLADQRRHSRSHVMPGAVRVALGAGDAAAFNSLAIHRGRYHVDKLRRTVMLTYAKSSRKTCDYFSYQPWFLNPAYRARIPADAADFFARFVASYRDDWKTQEQAS